MTTRPSSRKGATSRKSALGEPVGGARYSAPALDKGLDILELLAAEPDGLSQADIARRLTRSTSELFRMISRLVERSYLWRSAADDRYRLTAKLFELAHRFPPQERLVQAAVPAMRELAQATRQSCHLAVRNGEDAVVVAQIDGPGPHVFAVRVGAVVSLAESASGVVLSAFGATEIAAGDTGDDVLRLRRQRGRPVLERASTNHLGIVDWSTPIFADPAGYAPDRIAQAALTLPVLSGLTKASAPPGRRALVAALRAAAAAIETRLGGRIRT